MHEQKVERIIEQLQKRKPNQPLSLKKKAVSHEVPKPRDKRHTDEKLDISHLDQILSLDPENRICIAEPGVTFVDLVRATLKYGLVPLIVPELKTITLGGAVAGCSLESMSYKYGGFHDTCLEYEVITAKGEILTCTPHNEHSLVFQMMHGTFGTLGIISKLTFRLIPAKPFVKVVYQRYRTMADYQTAIWDHYQKKDVDFMDGIIHSAQEYVLSVAHFADAAPYTHRYDWARVYYQTTRKREEDYFQTPDYFFRYNRGVTNVVPRSLLGRILFGKFFTSTSVLKIVQKTRRIIPARLIPITMDVFVPFSRVGEFMEWYNKEFGHFPLWCVPYKMIRYYDWISRDYVPQIKDQLLLDLAIYGMRNRNDKDHYYKLMEDKLMEIGGLKTLISHNHYSESDFWKVWDKQNYCQVKRLTDPDNIFRDLYTKTCKTMRGIDTL